MIEAKKAAAIAEKQMWDKIDHLITMTAENGDTSIEVEYPASKIIHRLVSLGYSVKSGCNIHNTLISWSNYGK